MISTEKIKDLDTFTKIAKECNRFGQINCCQRLWKVAQSPINLPIWSHCLRERESVCEHGSLKEREEEREKETKV